MGLNPRPHNKNPSHDPTMLLKPSWYIYYFLFLDTKGEVAVDENYVGPLYEHVFPPCLAPSLAIVGLPWKHEFEEPLIAAKVVLLQVLSFQFCELQSRWIAMALSGKATLPSTSEMMKSVKDFYGKLAASGKTKHSAHNLATTQYEYDNGLAEQTGSAYVETWRVKIFEAFCQKKMKNLETYQDVWPDEDLHEEAYACLNKIGQCFPDRSSLKSSI